MLIFVDGRWPATIRKNLSQYGTCVPFATKNIVYDAIAGHPDIFFCQQDNNLVVAPNLPEKYFKRLHEHQINFIKGKLPVGNKYPATALYNAVVTQKYLIHNPQITDPVLQKTFSEKETIPVKQGYVRCNLLPLHEDVFITSDKGIEKALLDRGLEVHYFSPKGIRLPGYPHGFLGGCLGIHNRTVFVAGSMSHFAEGPKLAGWLQQRGYETVELYNGIWQDGGGIFFMPG